MSWDAKRNLVWETHDFACIFVKCVDHVTTKVPTKRTSDHLNLLYFTAFGIPPVLWLLAERPKAGVVGVAG